MHTGDMHFDVCQTKIGWSIVFSKMGHPQPILLFIFVFFNTVGSKRSMQIFPMTGFKPQISAVRSDRSTNWVTTTAVARAFLLQKKKECNILTVIFADS